MPVSDRRRPKTSKSRQSRASGSGVRNAPDRMIPGHRTIRTDDGRVTQLLINMAETPLGWLARRKGADGKPLISLEAFQAGERLREDFTKAGLSPHTTLNWDRLGTPISGRRGGGGVADGNIHTLDARDRFHAALDAVGPGLADLLISVCCHLQGLESAEQQFHWPARSGKVVLAIALDRLARHYGLIAPGAPERRAPGTSPQTGPRPSSAVKTALEVKSLKSG